jgi:hypothetical protein
MKMLTFTLWKITYARFDIKEEYHGRNGIITLLTSWAQYLLLTCEQIWPFKNQQSFCNIWLIMIVFYLLGNFLKLIGIGHSFAVAGSFVLFFF